MGEIVTEKPQSLIVEFVGLPGVGKTTVSQQVAFKLRERGLQIVSRDEILKQWHQENILQKALQLLPDNLNHWHILIDSLTFALQTKPIARQSFSKAVKIFTNVKRNDAVARIKDRDIILLDQGLLQEMWSVSITGCPPETRYLKPKVIPLFHNRPTLIIYCQLDIDTIVHRIQNRETMESRFDFMDSKQAYLVLEKYSSYLEEIIDCARTCGIPVIELNTSQAIESQSEKAVSSIIEKLT